MSVTLLALLEQKSCVFNVLLKELGQLVFLMGLCVVHSHRRRFCNSPCLFQLFFDFCCKTSARVHNSSSAVCLAVPLGYDGCCACLESACSLAASPHRFLLVRTKVEPHFSSAFPQQTHGSFQEELTPLHF